MRNLTTTLNRLGWDIERNQFDAWRRKWAFRLVPNYEPLAGYRLGGSGPHYFRSMADMAKWLENVQQVREWQALPVA